MELLTVKQKLLSRLAQAFDAYVNAMHKVACKEGCAFCCTQHVTVTTLEAYPIHRRLIDSGQRPADRLSAIGPDRFQPAYTTNEFAASCFGRKELPEDVPGNTSRPCPFLEEDRCTIYGIRPFACRAFLSVAHCPSVGQAEIPSPLASVIGICQQIIEHIDAGGCYGNLSDMLMLLDDGSKADAYRRNEPVGTENMPKAIALPGFLVPPEDQKDVNAFLSRLLNVKINGRRLYDLCDSLRPMPF